MERRHTFSHLKCLSLKLHTLRAAIPLLCASPELQITMKRVSSLHLMSRIPTPQATTFRRHKRGASPVYSFPAKPLSLIQAPLPCSKLLETHCAGCLPLSVCMTAKLSHSNLQHDARLTSKTEMFCPKQVFFPSVPFFHAPAMARGHSGFTLSFCGNVRTPKPTPTTIHQLFEFMQKQRTRVQ